MISVTIRNGLCSNGKSSNNNAGNNCKINSALSSFLSCLLEEYKEKSKRTHTVSRTATSGTERCPRRTRRLEQDSPMSQLSNVTSDKNEGSDQEIHHPPAVPRTNVYLVSDNARIHTSSLRRRCSKSSSTFSTLCISEDDTMVDSNQNRDCVDDSDDGGIPIELMLSSSRSTSSILQSAIDLTNNKANGSNVTVFVDGLQMYHIFLLKYYRLEKIATTLSLPSPNMWTTRQNSIQGDLLFETH